jgi:hypothetical protein
LTFGKNMKTPQPPDQKDPVRADQSIREPRGRLGYVSQAFLGLVCVRVSQRWGSRCFGRTPHCVGRYALLACHGWSLAREILFTRCTRERDSSVGTIRAGQISRGARRIDCEVRKPNKAPEPTSGSVTPRANVRRIDWNQPTVGRIAARGAPAPLVAHL